MKCDAKHTVVKLHWNVAEWSGGICGGCSGFDITPWNSVLLLTIWYLRSLLSENQFKKRFTLFHEQATINNCICVGKSPSIHPNVDCNVWMRACVLILMKNLQQIHLNIFRFHF